MRYACHHFLPRSIHLHNDRQQCQYELHKLTRAVRSPSLCSEAIRLWNWCIIHQILITAVYLPGLQHMIADNFSRHFTKDHDWELNRSILGQIILIWNFLNVVLVTTTIHWKCMKFCSRGYLCCHFLRVTFLLPCLRSLLYAFPPMPPIFKVLNIVRQDKARIILIIQT